MNTWKATPQFKKAPKLRNPILIEGLPGIGNVGKVAVDFIIDELKAEPLYSLFSHTLPHSVFVNEDNLVELPTIEIFYKQRKGKRDLLFLTGDVQPIDEVSSYEFCEKILDLLREFGGTELITTGGIGLQEVPAEPKVYATGNNKSFIKEFTSGTDVNSKIHGVVGPIVGATGILVGLAARHDLRAIALLVETFGHPLYLGVKGAQRLLEVLTKKLDLNINAKRLEKEVTKLEAETIKRTKDVAAATARPSSPRETSYIG